VTSERVRSEVLVRLEERWAPEPVRVLCRRQKSLGPVRNQTIVAWMYNV